MPEDMWLMPEEPIEEPRRRSLGAKVGLAVAAAALAALGAGGVAAAASAGGSHQAGTPQPAVQVQDVSSDGVGAAGTGDCPFHDQAGQSGQSDQSSVSGLRG